MSSFTRPLHVEILQREAHGRTLAALLLPFEYYDDEGKTYSVPIGFTTDFASVPRILWTIAPPLGPYAKAAVLHDYLCKNGPEYGLTRKDVDRLFYESMLVLRVNKLLAWSMWAAVRIGVIVRQALGLL